MDPYFLVGAIVGSGVFLMAREPARRLLRALRDRRPR
jgi:hypothetical protein